MRNTFLILFGSVTPKFALGILTFLIASFSLSGCKSRPVPYSQPPKQTTLGTDRVELPTTFINGKLYVELKINGKGPYLFCVDTGTDGMAVSPRVVREAGIMLSRKHTVKTHGSGGQHERLRWMKIDRLEAPLFSITNVGAVMLNAGFADLRERRVADSFGGYIGMAALQDVLLEIDYPQRKVHVARLASATLPAESGLPYTGVCPVVTISTPSAKHGTTTALIDTGADRGFTLTDIASYPVRVGLSKRDTYSSGIGGHWRPFFGQLAGDIRLGPSTWRDPEIESGVKNSLGSAALAPWKLVIDQKKKMLWLVGEGEEGIFTYTHTGPLDPDGRTSVYGYASLWEGDSWIVKEVDPGSRAERAGLKIGDVILPQNEDAIAQERAQKNDPFFVRLRIVRGAETLEITLSLSDPLPASAQPPP